MKTRHGFVTNSSSTSYICEITGHTETFFDSESYRDYGFLRCDNEHCFLEEFAISAYNPSSVSEMRGLMIEDYNNLITRYNKWGCPTEEEKQKLQQVECAKDSEIADLFESYREDMEYDIRNWQCPICLFQAFSQRELKLYLQKKYGITDDEVFAIVKQQNKRRKKLYDTEYISYVMQHKSLTEAELLQSVKAEFGNWQAYYNYIKSR